MTMNRSGRVGVMTGSKRVGRTRGMAREEWGTDFELEQLHPRTLATTILPTAYL